MGEKDPWKQEFDTALSVTPRSRTISRKLWKDLYEIDGDQLTPASRQALSAVAAAVHKIEAELHRIQGIED